MDLVQWVETTPLWLLMLSLFFAAWIEYVFPPFPGDTLVVAGGFFVAQGALPLVLTFIVLTCGSVAGCAVGWSLGNHGLGLRRFIRAEYLEKVSRGYKRYGAWLILGNRFVPGIRGAFMIAAGLVKMPLKAILIWGTISAVIWNSILISAGYVFSESLDEMLRIFQNYSKTVLILIGLAVIVWFSFRMGRLRSYSRRQAQKKQQQQELEN